MTAEEPRNKQGQGAMIDPIGERHLEDFLRASTGVFDH
jgi:hypothetical protein